MRFPRYLTVAEIEALRASRKKNLRRWGPRGAGKAHLAYFAADPVLDERHHWAVVNRLVAKGLMRHVDGFWFPSRDGLVALGSVDPPAEQQAIMAMLEGGA